MVIAVVLRRLLDHDGPCRHVDPDRERLRGEHRADEAASKTHLNCLLERRDHPGVMRRETRHHLRAQVLDAERVEVGVVERADPFLEDAVDLRCLIRVGEHQTCVEAGLGGRLALRP